MNGAVACSFKSDYRDQFLNLKKQKQHPVADPEVRSKGLSGEIHIKMGYAQLNSRVECVFAPIQQEGAGGSPGFADLCTVVVVCCSTTPKCAWQSKKLLKY